VDFKRSFCNCPLQGDIAHPDLCHCPQVGHKIESDLVARILQAEIDLINLIDEPPMLLRGGKVGEFNPDYSPTRR
jgi:hypothetical protein